VLFSKRCMLPEKSKEKIREKLSELSFTEGQRLVLEERILKFGEPKTAFPKLAHELNVRPQRVQIIEKRVLYKLEHHAREDAFKEAGFEATRAFVEQYRAQLRRTPRKRPLPARVRQLHERLRAQFERNGQTIDNS
jgi:hypothetical protein